MDIDIENLKEIFSKLLKKLEQNGYKRLNVNLDYYWSITTEESFSLEKTNPQIVIGSLQDDLICLQDMLKNDISTTIDIERFAHVLLAVSYVIHSSTKPYIC